jgi:signal transduction histidine kinase
LENLVDGVSPPDQATLQAALGQTERLGRLVNDLLDLSRVDAGLAPLDIEDLPAEPFLWSVVDEAKVGGRPVEYAVDVRPAGLVVRADRERLHQLLANLVDNAGRHSPSGATVTLRATRDTDRVLLDVVDEGPGIAPADRSAVFQRFTTGAAAAGDGGTGLGLAISRWVADLHGGSIEVADSSSGCHIRVALPDRSS